MPGYEEQIDKLKERLKELKEKEQKKKSKKKPAKKKAAKKSTKKKQKKLPAKKSKSKKSDSPVQKYRDEVKDLKKKISAIERRKVTLKPTRSFDSAIQRLNNNVEKLLELTRQTHKELEEDAIAPEKELLKITKDISEQNEKIAQGILAVADMVKQYAEGAPVQYPETPDKLQAAGTEQAQEQTSMDMPKLNFSQPQPEQSAQESMADPWQQQDAAAAPDMSQTGLNTRQEDRQQVAGGDATSQPSMPSDQDFGLSEESNPDDYSNAPQGIDLFNDLDKAPAPQGDGSTASNQAPGFAPPNDLARNVPPPQRTGGPVPDASKGLTPDNSAPTGERQWFNPDQTGLDQPTRPEFGLDAVQKEQQKNDSIFKPQEQGEMPDIKPDGPGSMQQQVSMQPPGSGPATQGQPSQPQPTQNQAGYSFPGVPDNNNPTEQQDNSLFTPAPKEQLKPMEEAPAPDDGKIRPIQPNTAPAPPLDSGRFKLKPFHNGNQK